MLLSLHQVRLPDWSPVQLGLWSSSRGAFAIYAPIYAQGHKVFSGISGEDLRWWNGESGKLMEEAFVRPGAVKKNSQGAWRALAGAVFGGQENRNLNLRIGNNKIIFDPTGKKSISINGQTNPAVKFASGRIPSMSEYNDSGLLSFTQINRRFGMLERVNNVPNTTFETALPWNMLNLSPESEEIDLTIRLSSDGYTLGLPSEGNTGKLIIDNKLGKTR